ncbi:MAG: type IV pilus assembly protein PilM [Planctomycetes bacterium]|nr:type IV pilus assembly protein PilM [Planctomycetota bacterium]
MFLKRSKSIVGLDIGSHAVKAVELTQVGSDYVLTEYGKTQIYSEGSISDAIAELLSHCRFRTKRVVTAVSGKSVIVRYLSLVQMSDEELRSAIRFEADKYIPFDVDDVVLDCQKLHIAPGAAGIDAGQDNEMRVLLVACKRSLVEDHFTLLSGLGLQPEIIDVDAFALGNAYDFMNRLGDNFADEDKVVALVDIGANKTNINIVCGNTSYFTREIYLGGDDFTGGIAKKLNLDLHEAEVLKRDPGEQIEEAKESVYPYIDDLGNEIRLSFDYYENQFDREVEEVYLSGGGARLVFLEEALEKTFEKKTTLWNPLQHLKSSDRVDRDLLEENAAQLAIAVGLASRLRAA